MPISASTTSAPKKSAPMELGMQIGPSKAESLTFLLPQITRAKMGIVGLDMADQGNAQKAIGQVKSAIEFISQERGRMGALVQRLEHTYNNLSVSEENLTSAESRIRDVDMADEITDFTKNNILSQTALSILAQANSTPQNVLSLLR